MNTNTSPSRILLVDDDREMLNALTFALQQAAYEVEARPDAISAINLIQTTAKPFHLVITDVSMPGMKGTQLLTALKTAFPATPVILFTAFGDWEQYAHALSEGAFEYLTKPVDKAELLASVRRALTGTPPRPATPPFEPN
jgi:two-component system, NtrC family, nitrogen regulation response regulator GlnG